MYLGVERKGVGEDRHRVWSRCLHVAVVLAALLAAAALSLAPSRLSAYQDLVKKDGTLLETTDAYALYLSSIMTCERYDFGPTSPSP
jgi:hypothetical protein